MITGGSGVKGKVGRGGRTDLKDVIDAAGLEELEAAVEGQVLVLERVGGGPRERRVHADVALVARERPEDDAPEHGLGDAVVALLDPLERDALGHEAGARVQQAVRRPLGRLLAGEHEAARSPRCGHASSLLSPATSSGSCYPPVSDSLGPTHPGHVFTRITQHIGSPGQFCNPRVPRGLRVSLARTRTCKRGHRLRRVVQLFRSLAGAGRETGRRLSRSRGHKRLTGKGDSRVGSRR